MSTKTISKLLIIFGIAIVFIAMGMDTTVGHEGTRVHNLPLAARQQNMLMLGGLIFIGGIILFSMANLKQTHEDVLKEDAEKEDREKRIGRYIGKYINRLGIDSASTRTRGEKIIIGLLLAFSVAGIVGGLWALTAICLVFAAIVYWRV